MRKLKSKNRDVKKENLIKIFFYIVLNRNIFKHLVIFIVSSIARVRMLLFFINNSILDV